MIRQQRKLEMIRPRSLDGLRIARVGVAHHAGGRIVEQYALDAPIGFHEAAMSAARISGDQFGEAVHAVLTPTLRSRPNRSVVAAVIRGSIRDGTATGHSSQGN